MKGYNILPVYEIEKNQYAGPAVFTADGDSLIAPDMLVFGKGKTFWIEAKNKTAFSWHRITGRWVTGIDLHHYEQYQQVARLIDWPVWLMFLQKGGHAVGSPPDSPSGLYGGHLDHLAKSENHRHSNWGKSGMVYWAIQDKQKGVRGLARISGYPL